MFLPSALKKLFMPENENPSQPEIIPEAAPVEAVVEPSIEPIVEPAAVVENPAAVTTQPEGIPTNCSCGKTYFKVPGQLAVCECGANHA
jgi:hypothetical protein